MAQIKITRVLTQKTSIDKTTIDSVEAEYSCTNGDVVLAVKQFALTTNNITYAAFGDAMKYWRFFPTRRDGWGHMPVWGFGDVVQSGVDGIEIGERFYGFFPVASHIIMRPTRLSERGFFDALPHRDGLPAVYNQYSRCSTDPGYLQSREDLQSLLRPLFITSYVLADFLADNDLFGAKQILISSASSKTAYGTAYCLKQINPACELVALTSGKNRDFVKGLGCYDSVLTYDDVSKADRSTKTTYVDFSGSSELRNKVHAHYAENLTYDCVVGSAQVASPFRDHSDLSPKPIFFFAPAQIAKRNKDYGVAEQTRRMLEAQNGFFAHITSQTPTWMTVQQHQGFSAAQRVIEQLLSGDMGPEAGNIVQL